MFTAKPMILGYIESIFLGILNKIENKSLELFFVKGKKLQQMAILAISAILF